MKVLEANRPKVMKIAPVVAIAKEIMFVFPKIGTILLNKGEKRRIANG